MKVIFMFTVLFLLLAMSKRCFIEIFSDSCLDINGTWRGGTQKDLLASMMFTSPFHTQTSSLGLSPSEICIFVCVNERQGTHIRTPVVC